MAVIAPTKVDQYTFDMFNRGLVHEIHTSERRSFRGCRRRWNWVREGYYPVTTARPLEFGTAFHKALETMFCPTTWNFNHMVLGALAEKEFVETCWRQKQEYLDAKDQYGLDGDLEEDYNERVALGRGMIDYFVRKQLPEIQQKYTPTHVEVSFDVPVYYQGNFLYCKCRSCRNDFAKAGGGKWKGNPVVFSGRVDAIMRDQDGGYWVLDWKTTTQFGEIEIYLELDDQVAGYTYALRRAMGLNIRGFIYFEIRKAFPEPPKENKTRRLGRLFSVNKALAIDYDTYFETVSVHDKEAYEAGLYDEILDFLKVEGVRYYRSFKIYKTAYELEQIELNLAAEVREMISPNVLVYPTPGRFSCSNCAYQGPCLSKNTGEDYEYALDTLYVRAEPYYKRMKEPSTDKPGD